MTSTRSRFARATTVATRGGRSSNDSVVRVAESRVDGRVWFAGVRMGVRAGGRARRRARVCVLCAVCIYGTCLRRNALSV